MELDKIITGDSAVVLQSFPSDCIDLSIQSPPYDNLRSYEGQAEFDFETIARQLFRVTKPGGVCVWVVGDGTVKGGKTLTHMRQCIFFVDVCGFQLHQELFYEKSGPPPDPTRYEETIEKMFIFSKGRPQTINLIKDKKNRWAGVRQFGEKSTREKDGSLTKKGKQVIADIGKRTVVWRYSTGFGYTTKDKIAFEHPATFPEALARDHILSWSNEGDIVLDCFAGSGTTLKMAKELSRHYIGIEREKKYVTIAEKRLLATSVPLFGLGRGLTPREPDKRDSSPSQAFSQPEFLSDLEGLS